MNRRMTECSLHFGRMKAFCCSERIYQQRFCEVQDRILHTFSSIYYGVYSLERILVHCKEDPIFYVFPEMKLCGIVPNFRTHVSLSDLYIYTIGPHILQQQNGQTDQFIGIYKSNTDT
jgi:hypothetical protein